MPISADLFKQLLSRFASGVTVVTFKGDEGIHGITVNAFSSVSLSPPLILICIDKQASSHGYLSDSDLFVVNILTDEQTDLVYKFADPKLSSEERFAAATYRKTPQGLPILDGCLAHLECRTVKAVDAGDHTVFIGEIEDGSFSEQHDPMVYYGGKIWKIVAGDMS